MLVDIGVNLTSKRFKSDLDQVVHDAIEAGVETMVVTGTTEQNSELALEIYEQWPDHIYSTAGIHPHHASDFRNATQGILEMLCNKESVVAVGECGLDFNRNLSPKKEQLYCFEAQLELGVDLEMPLFFHERDAHEDFIKLIRKYRASMKSGVVHCFTGDQNELEAYLDLDLHIGITGWICDERRGKHLESLIQMIPSNRLMIETDAPYLLPRNMDNKPKDNRNEPKYLPVVCKAVASCMDCDIETIAKQTTDTARLFFEFE